VVHKLSPSGRIRYLQRSYEDYMGFRWVGLTLWSEIQSRYERDPPGDLYCIKDLTPEYYLSMHKKSVDWLSTTLEAPQENKENPYPYIILTHHLPSYSLISTETFDDQYNEWHASHLDHLIIRNKDKIKAWFYGSAQKPKRSYMTIKVYDSRPQTTTPNDTHLALTKYGKTSSIAFLCNPVTGPASPQYTEIWQIQT
jgi:hypothetical protein